jgi:hypothetical protein
MMYDVKDGDLPRILINDRLLKAGVINAAVATDQPEKVISIRHKGIMEVQSEIGKDRTIYSNEVSFLQLINQWR